MIKYILLIFVFIYLIINKIIKLKKIEYQKNNLILKEILEIAYKSQIVEDAGVKIISILNKYFDYDYCSLYRYDKGRDSLNILCTTVDGSDFNELVELGNDLFELNKSRTDAYIESSNLPLNYKSTLKRNVHYIYFIPLKREDLIIGALLIEKVNSNKNEKTSFETEFFEVVTETITLALQNLIYFEKISNSAYLDGLTGVYNRKYMDLYLPKKFLTYSKVKIPFSIVMFDIDHFKKFNDTYGHQFGDLVLKDLSNFVLKNIRETDVLFRYGGEEFLIFMPNIDEITTFNRIEHIREAISNLILTDDKGVSAQITCSFGIVSFPSNGNSIDELINMADKALYYSKNKGRNRTTLYSERLFYITQ